MRTTLYSFAFLFFCYSSSLFAQGKRIADDLEKYITAPEMNMAPSGSRPPVLTPGGSARPAPT
ncbi:MAG: hypothetical protein M3Q97_04810, partial [Bacteroidota bacterium]|nr:hypothetical protein [Bacteroidota bacterium]